MTSSEEMQRQKNYENKKTKNRIRAVILRNLTEYDDISANVRWRAWQLLRALGRHPRGRRLCMHAVRNVQEEEQDKKEKEETERRREGNM